MAYLFQGRMVYPRGHRRAGRMHPRLYSGRRPRRFSHNYFGTQVSPYGAGGGGRRQVHTAPAGRAGNVYAHMLAQSRSGGTNLGVRSPPFSYRGTRMAKSFRKEQSRLRQEYRSRRAAMRRELRGASGSDKNAIRAQLQRIKGQHRVDRRQAAADWIKKNYGFRPRYGINVVGGGITGFGFRQAKGLQQRHLDRARKRNMRIANRMSGGKGLDMRLHGGQRKTGPQYGLPRTYADFTRGGNQRGSIRVGDHWDTGRYKGTVRRTPRFPASSNLRGTRPIMRPMSLVERQGASGRHAPWAREFIRSQNLNRATDRYVDYAMSERPTYQGWMKYNFKRTNR